jgi:hypothetical protein
MSVPVRANPRWTPARPRDAPMASGT